MAITNKWYDNEQYLGSAHALSDIDNRIRTISTDIRERMLSGGTFWPYDTTDASKASAGLSYCSPDAYVATKWQVYANSSNTPKLSQALLEVDGTTAGAAVLYFRPNGSTATLTCTSAGLTVSTLVISGTTGTFNGQTILTKTNYGYYTLCIWGASDSAAASNNLEKTQVVVPIAGTIVEFSSATYADTTSPTIVLKHASGPTWSGTNPYYSSNQASSTISTLTFTSDRAARNTGLSTAVAAGDLLWIDITANGNDKQMTAIVTIRYTL